MTGLPAWAAVSDRRREHVERVVALIETWAARMDVAPEEARRWQTAGWLHDALRDAPEAELRRLAGGNGPRSLLHGPAAASRAEEAGERDRGILAAVRWHSVGSPEWDRVGKVLYCADFLEPGRRFEIEKRARLAERFPAEPERVLYEVAQWRIHEMISAGWALPETTWRFWNALVAASAAA